MSLEKIAALKSCRGVSLQGFEHHQHQLSFPRRWEARQSKDYSLPNCQHRKQKLEGELKLLISDDDVLTSLL